MASATINPLGTERVGKLVVRHTVPSVVTMLVNSLYNIADQVFIGQGVGYMGNAATNVVMPMVTIIMAVTMMFGARGEVTQCAIDYGRIIVLGFPAFVICGGCGGFIRADGRPKTSMVGLLIGCATHMVLDPLFIIGFQWGVKGAAWSTIIGQI